MPTLDPNQQLAMAAGQLQQQYALPGAYNAPSFATEVERNATSITMGITNVALPGAAMATGLALSAAPMMTESLYGAKNAIGHAADLGMHAKGVQGPIRRAPSAFGNRMRAVGGTALMDPKWWGRIGMRMGGVKGGMAGIGKVGALRGAMGLAGGAMGILGSFQAPMAIASVYSSAADRMVEGQRDFLATRQMVRELPGLGGLGSQSVLGGGGGGPMGIASSPGSIAQLQGNMTSIGASFGASSAQMRNVTSGLASAGAIDTSSVQTISRSLRRSMQELQSIAKLVGTDLAEATNLYGQLKQMGFDSTNSRSSALRSMTGASGISGMSLSQVGSIANTTMGMASQIGLNPTQGLGIATSAISNAAYRQSTGSVNPMYMHRVGGLEGYAQRMAQIQVGVAGSGGADAAISRLYTSEGNLRAGGLGDLHGRDRLRSRRSFNRDFDPYQMGNMRREFAERSDAVILGGVNSIQARNAGDPTRANRRQYEYLAQFGISDPDEQQEYLSSLRSRPRSDALAHAQTLQNEALTSGGTREGVDMGTRVSDALSDFVRRVVGSGEALEKYGAALQVRAERVMQGVNDAFLGSERSMAGAMYTEEAIDFTRESIQGGGPGIYNNPLATVERMLGESPNMRSALGQSRNISGVNSEYSNSAGFRAAYGVTQGVNGVADWAVNALGMGLTPRGPTIGRGSFYSDFGSSVPITGTARNGTYVGDDARGRRRYGTGAEVIQMAAARHGAGYDASTQRFVEEDTALTASLLYSQSSRFAQLEDMFLDGGQSSDGQRSIEGIERRDRGWATSALNWMLGESADDTLGQGRNYQLSESQRSDVRRDSMIYLNEFSNTVYRDSYGNLSEVERVSLLSALRQSPGQVGREVAGEVSGISGAALAAEIGAEAASSGLRGLLGQGSFDQQRVARGNFVNIDDTLGGRTTSTWMAMEPILRGTAGVTDEGMIDTNAAIRILEASDRPDLAPIMRRMQTNAEGGSSPHLRNGRYADMSAAAVRAQREIGAKLGLEGDDVESIVSRFEGGNALSTLGAIRGAMHASRGISYNPVAEYIMGGTGSPTFGEGAEVGEGMRGYTQASVAGMSYVEGRSHAVGMSVMLGAMKRMPLSAEQRARLDTAESEIFTAGGRYQESALGSDLLGRIRAGAGNSDDVQAGIRNLAEVAGWTRASLLLAGNAINQRSSEATLGVMRKNQVRGLANALAGQRISVGDRTYDTSDLLLMADRGTLTADFANELFESESVRDGLLERRTNADGSPNTLVEGLMGLSGERATAVNTVVGLYESAFVDGKVAGDRLEQFRGTQGERAMGVLSRIASESSRGNRRARGVDIAELEENFSQSALTAMLDRMGVSGEGFDRDRLDSLVGRLEGGLDSNEQTVMSSFFAATMGLGEEAEGAEQSAEDASERRDFYRGMNRALGGSHPLAVAIVNGDGQMHTFRHQEEE